LTVIAKSVRAFPIFFITHGGVEGFRKQHRKSMFPKESLCRVVSGQSSALPRHSGRQPRPSQRHGKVFQAARPAGRSSRARAAAPRWPLVHLNGW
jgi:hypothetical protein